MNSVAHRHLDEQEGSFMEFSMMNVDAQCRLDSVGAYLDQHAVECFHLFAGHARNPSVVVYAKQEYAAARVGESAQFVGKIFSTGAGGGIAAEFNLLEFPAAIFAEPQSLTDFLVGDCHASVRSVTPTPFGLVDSSGGIGHGRAGRGRFGIGTVVRLWR